MEFLASLDNTAFRLGMLALTGILTLANTGLKPFISRLQAKKAQIEREHENSPTSLDARRISHEQSLLAAQKKEIEIVLAERGQVAERAEGIKDSALSSSGEIADVLKLLQKITPKIVKAAKGKSEEKTEGEAKKSGLIVAREYPRSFRR